MREGGEADARGLKSEIGADWPRLSIERRDDAAPRKRNRGFKRASAKSLAKLTEHRLLRLRVNWLGGEPIPDGEPLGHELLKQRIPQQLRIDSGNVGNFLHAEVSIGFRSV